MYISTVTNMLEMNSNYFRNNFKLYKEFFKLTEESKNTYEKEKIQKEMNIYKLKQKQKRKQLIPHEIK